MSVKPPGCLRRFSHPELSHTAYARITPLRTSNTGLDLHYRTWGEEGAPPLVLVHGLASTSLIWDFVAPILAESLFRSSIRSAGHALSAKPADGYDLPTMLADLVGFIDALQFEKPVVVGHSWGRTWPLLMLPQTPTDAARWCL